MKNWLRMAQCGEGECKDGVSVGAQCSLRVTLRLEGTASWFMWDTPLVEYGSLSPPTPCPPSPRPPPLLLSHVQCLPQPKTTPTKPPVPSSPFFPFLPHFATLAQTSQVMATVLHPNHHNIILQQPHPSLFNMIPVCYSLSLPPILHHPASPSP